MLLEAIKMKYVAMLDNISRQYLKMRSYMKYPTFCKKTNIEPIPVSFTS